MLKCGHNDYNFSRSRCKSCATIQDTKKRIDAYEASEESESQQNLIEDLDAIFSRFIRLKYADDKGIVDCYTCPTRLPVGQIQNGHFIHRTDLATRFMEQNCRPQCPNCNRTHNDDATIFRDKLEAEQKGITDWLLAQSREVCKPTLDELKQLISAYRHKVKLLEYKLKKQP